MRLGFLSVQPHGGFVPPKETQSHPISSNDCCSSDRFLAQDTSKISGPSFSYTVVVAEHCGPDHF
jgi:hypothetical protein